MYVNAEQLRRLWKDLGILRVIEREEFSRLVRTALKVRKLKAGVMPYKIRDDYRRVMPTRISSKRYHREGKLEFKREGIERSLVNASWTLHGVHRIMKSFRSANEVIVKDEKLLTAVIKRAALFYGADLVGIAPFDDRWLYEGFEMPFKPKCVIVLAFEMDLGVSSDDIIAAEVGYNYSKMSFTVLCLAKFISGLGFNALPQCNEGSLSIPFGILAGLGEIGRMGLLVTPEYGARVRLAKVFTDAPLVVDNPISFGLWEKCMDCCICADACPVGAIPYGPPSWESKAGQVGVYKWHIDPKRCYSYWVKIGRSCAKCVYACPYSKALWDLYRIEAKRRALRYISSLRE
ncbi:MAG: hypothetical protein DRZ82_01610 [Thermoprotei archaeon]|nr:MAG: hypothetical protein DRZ82_01610 [Thermoprotei archaeon]